MTSPDAGPPDAGAPDGDPTREGALAERDRIRRDLGGADKVVRLRGAGRLTARDRIDALLDTGSFHELGTFARSERPEDRAATPGDGKVCGHGTIDGRPVAVVVDDVTVKGATSSLVGARKLQRTYERAERAGEPFVFIGETGGARLPDTLSAVGYAGEPVFPWLARRQRAIPVVAAIVGRSYGASSFVAGLADFVVQVRGSTLAVTSPRVVEVATGEIVSEEELGGIDVHARTTGQIDVAVDTDEEAHVAIRAFLGHLPSRAGGALPRRPARDDLGPDPDLAALVPERRARAYDVRRVVRRIVDDGELLELKPAFGASLVTGLARIDGWPVGVIASQPMTQGGALTPDACSKAARLLCCCDAFGLPVVVLQDTPGFLVGTHVEHGRVLAQAMLFLEALTLARVPRLVVVLRKAFGLAYFSLGGSGMGSDLLVAWPGAELGFMDPVVGANVLHADRLATLEPDARRAELDRLAAELGADTDPRAVAGAMLIDEVIDPADTRAILATELGRVAPTAGARPSVLAAWPHWW
jgi:methylmalonyl-CoA decarboxylase subunit alpha